MNDLLAQTARALSTFPVSLVVKASAILATALVARRCMSRAPASMRHLVLALGFAALFVLPLAEALGPGLVVRVGATEVSEDVVLPITAMAAETTRVVSAPVARAGAAPEQSGTIAPRVLLLIAWAIGAALCLVPIALTPAGTRRLRRTARRWSHGEALVQGIESDTVTTRRKVAVLVHDEVSAPVTCGVMRPTIVLPAGAPRWEDAELRRALVHELEHVRRADWPVQLATRIVSALYWFHPLAWIAWRRLCLEAERACDDAVLRVAEPAAYAEQLVSLAKQRRPSAMMALSMAGRSDLSARITAVLDESQVRGRVRPAGATAVAVTATLLLAVVGSVRATPQTPQPVQAQAANATAFEVVSIRENKTPVLDKDDSSIAMAPGGRFVTVNWPVRELIVMAFDLQPQQLVNAPDWINAVRYDISATAAGPLMGNATQLAIQRMLADRFRLVVHRETRPLPIFALTLARSDGRLGPQMAKSSVDCEAIINANMQAKAGEPRIEMPRLPDGRFACSTSHRFGRVFSAGTTMRSFAEQISRIAPRIVHDRTGLQGGYNIEMEFTPDPSTYAGGAPPPGAPLDPNAPSFFTALEEQLGLKLEPAQAPVDVLVIDRIERPTEN